jgi:TatD DNase family protein
MFVDTHAHLQWPSFDNDRANVLARAKEQRVTRIVNIGFDLAGCVKGVALADKHSGLYAAVGIHPHSATTLNSKTVDALREFAANPKVLAIGEIGLDYYRNLSPKAVQQQAFETQLTLAQELNLSVVVHDREAHNDILKTLTKFKGEITGIIHCFSGNKTFAQQCIDLGFLISFAGNVTYPKAHELHEAAEWLDPERMLIETDCPWLTPQEMRGRRNEPSFLSFTAQKIAALKHISVAELAQITAKNAERILKLPMAP